MHAAVLISLCRRRKKTLRRFLPSWNCLMKTTRSRKYSDFSMRRLTVLLKLFRFKIGDSFFYLPVSEAQEVLSSSASRINDEVSSLEEQLSGLRDEMNDLKAALYGRFGTSINLEA
jgi:hypothetical protein